MKSESVRKRQKWETQSWKASVLIKPATGNYGPTRSSGRTNNQSCHFGREKKVDHLLDRVDFIN